MKNLTTSLICIFCALSIFTSAQVTNTTHPANSPYATIQAAINDAITEDGDIITVAVGIYRESISLNKRLILRGAKAGVDGFGRVDLNAWNVSQESFIQSGPYASAIKFQAGSSGSEIDGFALNSTFIEVISNSGSPALMDITIRNNWIFGQVGDAINLPVGILNLTIEHNELIASQTGVYLGSGAFHGFWLTNNHFNGVSDIDLHAEGNRNVGTNGLRKSIIRGNDFYKGRTGLYAGPRSFENVLVTENIFRQCIIGFHGGPKNCVIEKNIFQGNQQIGLLLNGFDSYFSPLFSPSDPTLGASGTIVRNNFFSNNGASNTSPYGDVFLGNQAAGMQSSNIITENSLLSANAINSQERQGTVDPINAPCNWYGTTDPSVIATRIFKASGAVVNFKPYLTNGTDNDLVTPGFQPVPASCNGLAPVLVALANGIQLTSSNNGISEANESASFAVCNVANNIHFNSFEELVGVTPVVYVRLRQEFVTSNVNWSYSDGNMSFSDFNSSSMYRTASLIDPNVPGTLMMRFRTFYDANLNNAIDAGESTGDWLTYNVTIPVLTWYADADQDTYGDANNSVHACSQPAGYVLDNTDCNDASAAINSAAEEVCDGRDNNCNGLVDEGFANSDGDSEADCIDRDDDNDGVLDENDCGPLNPNVGTAITWYRDNDQDGFGNPNESQQSCTQPPGYVPINTDCDDTKATVHPNATEICNNGIDDDCDGLTDDADPDVVGQNIYYADNDDDGYGTGEPIRACVQPAHTSANAEDCDDTKASVHPHATEICNNGIDDDCDGLADDADPDIVGQNIYYADNDGDGYGAGPVIRACVQPDHASSNADDCDDTKASVHPHATEICNNGIDDDCDGLADDADPDVVGQNIYYADNDGDGYGAGTAIRACVQPAHTSSNAQDCDDTKASVHPHATEICNNGIDDDCDGLADDADPDVVGQNIYYADNDGDGYGAGPAIRACVQPTHTSSNAQDCDDTKASVHPHATEICNGIDDDCDGLADDADPDVVGQNIYYADNDSDGFGAGPAIRKCVQPNGTVTNNLDCDDTKATYGDNDGDGYGAGPKKACGVDNNQDCNDADEDINPETIWFKDNDGDSYGNPAISFTGCIPPSGNWVFNNHDCNDNDSKKKEQVLMCKDGREKCVKPEDVSKNENKGWTLGPCASPCKDDRVQMCHNGHVHCVKPKDVNKNIANGWTVGPCVPGYSVVRSMIAIPVLSVVNSELTATNYPNPFSQKTKIVYSLPFNGKVSVIVYDIMGRPIISLVNADKVAGEHTAEFDGGKFGSGTYFYRITAIGKGEILIKKGEMLKSN